MITERGEQFQRLPLRDQEGGTQFWTVIVPPVPDMLVELPVGSTAIGSVIPRVTDGPLVGFASVAVTVATTPLAIVVEFIPEARQIIAPLALLQVTVFCAPLSTEPVFTLTELISLVEYVSVHCKALGKEPEPFHDRFKVTLPPWTAEPEDNWRELV